MVSDISKLVASIKASAMPQWLRDYLNTHRDRMGAELKLFGTYDIPTPDGDVIHIEAKDRSV